MKLDPEALIVRIDKTESMAAEAVHVAIRGRNTAIAHDHGDLMQGFGQERPEIPVVLGAVHVGARIAFDHMVEVGKF